MTPFDAEKAAIVATLESMGFRNVDVGWSAQRTAVLIHASRRHDAASASSASPIHTVDHRDVGGALDGGAAVVPPGPVAAPLHLADHAAAS